MSGPLTGFRILEVGGQGPVPFAALMMADLGADVVRVDRGDAASPGRPEDLRFQVRYRGRRNIAIDLKHPDGAGAMLDLVTGADALLEGYRPGVMERLHVGPDECLARNPRLVFARMTGWGQEGPYSALAGHDINYVALAGALAHFPRAGQTPTPPLALAGDLAGGGMLLAYGVVCALLESQRSGQGQVIDAAVVDGVALLMTNWWGDWQRGTYDERRPGTPYFDMGSHFYNVYRCADGEYLSIASREQKFYDGLLSVLGLESDPAFAQQYDADSWPELQVRLQEIFGSKTREEWCQLLLGHDICFAPVLRMSEAAQNPHNVARGTFVEVDGVTQPGPAPRFSRTVATLDRPPAVPGQHTREILEECGVASDRIDDLLRSGAVSVGGGNDR